MDQSANESLTPKEWWSKKRIDYIQGLIFSVVVSNLIPMLISYLLMPRNDDPDDEITIVDVAFIGIFWLIMILIANVFYNLGSVIDRIYNKDNTEEFRIRIYKFGYWFSVSLPFLLPLFALISYFVNYAK